MASKLEAGAVFPSPGWRAGDTLSAKVCKQCLSWNGQSVLSRSTLFEMRLTELHLTTSHYGLSDFFAPRLRFLALIGPYLSIFRAFRELGGINIYEIYANLCDEPPNLRHQVGATGWTVRDGGCFAHNALAGASTVCAPLPPPPPPERHLAHKSPASMEGLHRWSGVLWRSMPPRGKTAHLDIASDWCP